MSEISETHWSAGWLFNLEFILWRKVLDDGPESFQPRTLKDLAERAGGWWIWDSKSRGRRFVEMKEWKEIFELVGKGKADLF